MQGTVKFFNLAADPVLDAAVMAEALGARIVPVPAAVARAAVLASWKAHVQPTDPGWLDIALNVPVLDTSRAQRELDWHPKVNSVDAMMQLIEGMINGAGAETPPLHPPASNPASAGLNRILKRH